MSKVSRKELEKAKGMTVRQMERFCPDVLAMIKAVIGEDGCWVVAANVAADKWNLIQGSPGWVGDCAYFPTDEQLTAYYKPESKFEVGSVWCDTCGTSGRRAMKINKVECGWVFYETLWAGKPESFTRSFRTDSMTAEECTPFYAPPSQDKLDEWGKEIDRIGLPCEDEQFASTLRQTIIDCTVVTKNCSFNGLRYILKDKAKPESSVVIIDKPEHKFLKELSEFCIKWTGLPEGTLLRSCEITAQVGEIATIKTEVFAREK